MENFSPVLSEQITDTEPRASTECSFFTMAFRLDILSTPKASVTVVTMGSPSGIAATASDTALQVRSIHLEVSGVTSELYLRL